MKKDRQGMSLIEILIVVSVFAILGVLTTQAVATTLKGARKSDSQIKVRENINYAFSVMERQLRSADSISVCPNPDTTSISYTSLEGISTSFSCVMGGGTGYISSGSARLTSTDIVVNDCEIVCEQTTENRLPRISISVSASDANSSGSEKGVVEIKTEIVPRNY